MTRQIRTRLTLVAQHVEVDQTVTETHAEPDSRAAASDAPESRQAEPVGFQPLLTPNWELEAF
ncbi:MAG TPA: hypothetical protein VK506_02560 [Conexibacter sp.]|nr:hypothetical protein [Conexibacter sp.]